MSSSPSAFVSDGHNTTVHNYAYLRNYSPREIHINLKVKQEWESSDINHFLIISIYTQTLEVKEDICCSGVGGEFDISTLDLKI